MKCVNQVCGREIEDETQFCTFCGTAQPVATASPEPRQAATASTVGAPAAVQTPSQAVGKEIVVMRAGDGIWNFTEPEGQVQPGQTRPVVIMDEQVTQLAHTDRHLGPNELYERVRSYLDRFSIPVDVSVVRARWLNDEKEVRDRIVASLRAHPFKDIKMIMGLDYMGPWASFKVYLGMQPDVVPEQSQIPKDVLIAALVGGVCLVVGLIGKVGFLSMAGFVALGYAGVRFYLSKKAAAASAAASMAQRALERFSRTYKTDDMRLFCSAMTVVFSGVIDDIVRQEGAKVIKVEGGQGGFFAGSGTGPAQASVKMSDAAELSV